MAEMAVPTLPSLRSRSPRPRTCRCATCSGSSAISVAHASCRASADRRRVRARSPADQISLADVFRAIDGPLAEVHDLSLTTLEYRGRLRAAYGVLAVRASLRRVLETVISPMSPRPAARSRLTLADEYETAVADRPPSGR